MMICTEFQHRFRIGMRTKTPQVTKMMTCGCLRRCINCQSPLGCRYSLHKIRGCEIGWKDVPLRNVKHGHDHALCGVKVCRFNNDLTEITTAIRLWIILDFDFRYGTRHSIGSFLISFEEIVNIRQRQLPRWAEIVYQSKTLKNTMGPESETWVSPTII